MSRCRASRQVHTVPDTEPAHSSRSNDRNLARTFCKRAAGQVALWPVVNSTLRNGVMTSCNATAVFMLQVWINGTSGHWRSSGLAPNHEYKTCCDDLIDAVYVVFSSSHGLSRYTGLATCPTPVLTSPAILDHTLASLTTGQRAGSSSCQS